MKHTLRAVVAQLNLLVGDIKNNSEKIIHTILHAKENLKADLVIFSEMAITAYPPEDLLLRPEFYSQINDAIIKIANVSKDVYVLIGYPEQNERGRHNKAAILYNGKIIAKYNKQFLPNYGVFDEKRYFQPGKKPCIVDIKGIKTAITICEDMWFQEPMKQAIKEKASLIISINASPFDLYKPFVREKIMATRVNEGKIPLIYANCVGGQDELIFDGGSFVMNETSEITERASFFQEQLMLVELEKKGNSVIPKQSVVLPILSKYESIYKALVLGVKDYVEKNRFPGVIIGISGGIDSALTLAIAVDALGAKKVHTVFMPSQYTSEVSREDSKEITSNFGVYFTEISIEPIFKSFLQILRSEFKGAKEDQTEENLQARCRGTILMAISNKQKYMVLSTGNKSEMAVGYSTLYGDMVGGFSVLKDVPKTLVYKLVEYRNNLSEKPLIPKRIIERPPSAELKPDQKDIDSLPPYDILDEILERFVEKDQSLEQIIEAGFDESIVKNVIKMVTQNEYKRRQSPTGVRITTRAFGRDRRYPITSGFDSN